MKIAFCLFLMGVCFACLVEGLWTDLWRKLDAHWPQHHGHTVTRVDPWFDDFLNPRI